MVILIPIYPISKAEKNLTSEGDLKIFQVLGDLENSILRPEILHGALHIHNKWENIQGQLKFNQSVILTHPNGWCI